MKSQDMVSPRLEIEAVLSVAPFKATGYPRQTRQVSVTAPADSGIFRTCLNLILCYNKVGDDRDSGWMVAGWMVESLAKALVEQPMLSGRLRRGEDGNGELEIVSNDSGLRLLQAKIAMTLSEFLGLKGTGDGDAEADHELVFWKDIDEQNPQYDPLFYVQVTNFECGGYSIGISCSILLADLLIMENFLKKWSDIHKAMLSENTGPKTPIFYLPNHKRDTCSSPVLYPSSSNRNKTCGVIKMFRISDCVNVNLGSESVRKLMLVCVEEAERELGAKMGAKFPVFSKGLSNAISIGRCCTGCANDLVESQSKLRSQVSAATWDFLGASGVAFFEGNKPAGVRNWIGSVSSDGLVLTSSCSDEGTFELSVVVSIP